MRISVIALLKTPLAISLLISSAVFLAVMGLRQSGSLQALELVAYDFLIRELNPTVAETPRVALVTITENDIQTLGSWPIPNGVLAEALEKIAEQKPRSVGVDIYLDVPVPPGREALEAVLLAHQNIITAIKFPRAADRGVPPPSVLEGTQQFGFTDMIVDAGGIVRRGLLFLNNEQMVGYSLALQLTLLYLQAEGVVAQPDRVNPEHIRLGQTTIPPFESNDGSYIKADAGGYQFLLDYREIPGQVPTIALLPLLAGEADPALFRDRAVLVGVAAESVKDVFYTPFSREEGVSRVTPGVSLHASIVSQLLRFALDGDQPMKTLNEYQEYLWVLLWSLLGGGMGLAIRSPVRFLLIAAAGVAVLYGIVHLAFAAGWWLPSVPTGLTWLLSATLATAYVSYREMQERAKLMTLFSRHISRQLAVDIWENREQFLSGGHPKPQRLTATTFFSDVAGFTTVSERLEPPELMDWLNEYMEVMTPILNEHEGVILRFIGDAIMAVFGVPIPRETEAEIGEDAVKAVDCALAMREALIVHNRKLEDRGDPLICMRIGIYTGTMVAGSIGDAERLEYNVHGDSVNTASRLEGFEKEKWQGDYFNDPCRIFIGESTLAYVGERYATELVGEVKLKGKDQFTKIYRVLGRREGEPMEMIEPGEESRLATSAAG